MMRAKLIRLVKRTLIGLTIVALTLLVLRVWQTQRGAPLEPWHTYVPHELSVEQLDKTDWEGYLKAEANIFERLRAVRKRLADAEGVPAYIVFSDAVLRGLAERIPRTPQEMLLVSGIGPVKLERYGEAFLEALREAAPAP